MSNPTIIFTFFISFLFLGQISAQTEVALFSRHKLFDGGVDLRNSDDTNLIVPFGFAVELIRDRTKYKVYAFGAGFRIRNHQAQDEGTTNEIFIQGKYQVFKDFAKSDKLSAYFSLAPRLAFLYNNELTISGFDSNARAGGVEIPLLFSLDYVLTDRWNLHFNINTITAAFFLDHQFVDNPNLPLNARTNTGFDFDGTLFNEMRIGVGYTLLGKLDNGEEIK